MQMHVKEENLEIHFFIYSDNREITAFLRDVAWCLVLFITKTPLFHNFVFFSSINIRVFLKACAKLQYLHPVVFITVFSVYYVLINCVFV